jgi:PAS domain S-box-containing protein
MPEVIEQTQNGESVRELENAFRQFNERASVLRQTYVELRGEVARMNHELERVNRRLEAKVQELEEVSSFQNSILSSIPVGVTVTDLDGVIQRFNPPARDIWGVDAEEAIGSSIREVMGCHGQLLERVLAGEPGRRTIQRHLEENGMVLATTVSVVRDSRGRSIGAIQLDRDVSRMRRLEDRLCRCENMADLGRSAAGLAHEVRKPLNGIKGFASLLRRMADGEQVGKYSSRIMQAASRLDAMLEDLLDFARPTGLEPCELDLDRIARSVADLVSAENVDRPRNVRILVDIPPGARRVIGDAGKIEQVLLNLVKNGVEAIEDEGKVRISARPAPEPDEDRIRVIVEDTGTGIAPERLEAVQEPFTSDKERGIGLGLAMVKKFLRLHGTDVEIDSVPGEGTSVTFTLPAAEKGEQDDS